MPRIPQHTRRQPSRRSVPSDVARVPRVKRGALILLGIAVVAAVPAVAATRSSVDVLHAFKKQIPFLKTHTTVPILLPSTLPFGGKVPKVYATGFANKNEWGLELAGAANCGGGHACRFSPLHRRPGGGAPPP